MTAMLLTPSVTTVPDEEALHLPLDWILPGKNVRTDWDQDDEELQRLRESIAQVGLQQPLSVRRLHTKQNQFELIFGYRRYRACQQLGHTSVICRVIRARDDEVMALQLAENLARKSMSEADIIKGVEYLQQTYGWGVRQIAAHLGRTPSWVSQVSMIARSPEERALLEEGKISLTTAAKVARLKEFPVDRQRFLEEAERGTLLGDQVPTPSTLGVMLQPPREEAEALLVELAPSVTPPSLLRPTPRIYDPLEVDVQFANYLRNAVTYLVQSFHVIRMLRQEQGPKPLPTELRIELDKLHQLWHQTAPVGWESYYAAQPPLD